MNRNNKGFSLIELIIVVAIMAVLMGIIAPQYLQYVGKAKRTADVANAKQIAEAMDMMLVTENADIKVDGKYMTGFMWDKNAKPSKGTNTLYDKMMESFGSTPVSEYNNDFLWCMFYAENSFGYLDVSYIYLVENPGDTMGYEVYPDATKYLENIEKVKIATYK